METKILNMISNASINGYYDPSLKLVVVWFHNIEDEADLVAYLQKDMTWDLRKVKKESSCLYEDKEIVEVLHENIDKFKPDSEFDQVVRKVLNQLIDHSLKENVQSPRLEMMKIVLDNNNYHNVNN